MVNSIHSIICILLIGGGLFISCQPSVSDAGVKEQDYAFIRQHFQGISPGQLLHCPGSERAVQESTGRQFIKVFDGESFALTGSLFLDAVPYAKKAG